MAVSMQMFSEGAGASARARVMPGDGRAARLLPKPKSGDDRSVAVHVLVLKIVEVAAALADKLQQAMSRVVVVPVRFQVLNQLVDSVGQDGNLNCR